MGGDCGQGPAGERRLSSIHPSFLRPQDATLALASRRQAWIRLIAFSAHVSASSGCACFCSISAARSQVIAAARRNVRRRNGEEGPLRRSSSNPALANSIRGSSPTKKGRWAASHDRLRATLREDGPDLPRITNGGLPTREMGLIRALHSRHRVRARWSIVTGTWILPRSLMMPESARRGREKRYRRCHAVCR